MQEDVKKEGGINDPKLQDLYLCHAFNINSACSFLAMGISLIITLRLGSNFYVIFAVACFPFGRNKRSCSFGHLTQPHKISPGQHSKGKLYLPSSAEVRRAQSRKMHLSRTTLQYVHSMAFVANGQNEYKNQVAVAARLCTGSPNHLKVDLGSESLALCSRHCSNNKNKIHVG